MKKKQLKEEIAILKEELSNSETESTYKQLRLDSLTLKNKALLEENEDLAVALELIGNIVLQKNKEIDDLKENIGFYTDFNGD